MIVHNGRLNRRLVSEWILALLSLSMGYLINGIITDIIKNSYGRPRPDFLSRCFTPNIYSESGPPDNFWLTLPSG